MKPIEIYQEMQRIKKPCTLTLSPGPFRIRADWHDAFAAKLILWLTEQLPVNTTLGDLHDILEAALWWQTFWASQPTDATTPLASEATNDGDNATA